MRHPKLVRIRAALRIPGCAGPCRGIRANMEHTSTRIGLGHCVRDVEDAVGTGRGHRWKGLREELGVSPCPATQALHARLLHGQPLDEPTRPAAHAG
jgi:hypothetical protein